MSTENEGLLEVRDLKVHVPLPKKSLFGERSYVKAVDGVSFRVRKAHPLVNGVLFTGQRQL